MNSKNHSNVHIIIYLLPVIGSFILLINCIATMLKGHYSFLTLGLFMYSDLILIHFCKNAYERLPLKEKSLRKFMLKLVLWLLNSGILFAIVGQSAPFYGPLTAALFYAMAIGGSLLLFYGYMICDGGGEESSCAEEEKRAFSLQESGAICEKE